MAYYKIKFIEYWIQNCSIPPNKEASELFKDIIEINYKNKDIKGTGPG